MNGGSSLRHISRSLSFRGLFVFQDFPPACLLVHFSVGVFPFRVAFTAVLVPFRDGLYYFAVRSIKETFVCRKRCDGVVVVSDMVGRTQPNPLSTVESSSSRTTWSPYRVSPVIKECFQLTMQQILSRLKQAKMLFLTFFTEHCRINDLNHVRVISNSKGPSLSLLLSARQIVSLSLLFQSLYHQLCTIQWLFSQFSTLLISSVSIYTVRDLIKDRREFIQ